ncbi:MAG TPA: hypothetical protein DEQ61_01330, partial [Streptomyces sp.]|nr:hypothetical protein [Streptomyces sp.]
MTEQDHERAEARGGSPLPGPAGRLALAFEAFRAFHREAWTRYARTQVGDAAAAEQVVETVARQLALDWAHALRRESVAEYAWAILKEHIAQWLRDHGRSPELAVTDPSGTAIHELLEISRERFAGLEGEDGLYAALGRLPERQYDVLVLRYVLGYPEDRVAAYLGIAASAVRSHIRRAERRLTGEAEESRLPPVPYGDAPPPAAPNG